MAADEREHDPEEERLALRLRVERLERELELAHVSLGQQTAFLDAVLGTRVWRAVARARRWRELVSPAAAVAAGADARLPASAVRIPLAGLHDDGPAPPEWRDAIDVAGVVLPGALIDPPTTLRWRLDPHGGRVVVRAFAALRPGAWLANRTGVRFRIAARAVGGSVLAEEVVELHPAGRPADRRWVPLTLALREDAGAVEVELAADIPGGAEAAFAWAAWGDPVLLAAAPGGVVAPLPARSAAWRALARRRTGGRGDEVTTVGRDEAPVVSLLMPVHDPDPGLLRATLDAVRAQTDGTWQLCVADDGSRDAAVGALLAEAAADPRVVVDRSEEAGGISAATSRALAHATGEFVATLDHDDLLAPDAIAVVRAELSRRPDLDVLYSDNDKVEGTGVRFAPALKPDWSPDYMRACMYTLHLGVYRRALVEEVGGWRSELDGAQDHDLVLRLSERTDRIAHVPRTLYSWRAHAGSASLDAAAKDVAFDRGAQAVAAHLARVGVDATVERLAVPGRYRVVHRRGEERVAVLALDDSGDVRERARDADVVVLTTLAAEPGAHGWEADLCGPLRETGVGAVAPVVVDGEDRVVEAGRALLGGLPLPVHPGAPTTGRHVPDELTMVTNRSAAGGVVALRAADLDAALEVIGDDRGPLALVAATAALTARGARLVVTPHAPWRLTGAMPPTDVAALRRFAAAHRGRRDPLYSPRLWQDRAAHVVPRALTARLLADVAT